MSCDPVVRSPKLDLESPQLSSSLQKAQRFVSIYIYVVGLFHAFLLSFDHVCLLGTETN